MKLLYTFNPFYSLASKFLADKRRFFVSFMVLLVLYGTIKASAQVTKLVGTGVTGGGSIFALDEDGTNPEKWVDMPLTVGLPRINNSLVESNGKLWGITVKRGANDQGGIFHTDLEGTNYTQVHDFDGTNGGQSLGNLVESNGRLWGMTSQGGINNLGVIFSIDTTGTGYLVVHEFDGTNGGSPFGTGLVESNGKLWGITSSGGVSNVGVIFSINVDGSGYVNVHNFDGVSGSFPAGNLIESNGKLWGMTRSGGASNVGVIFSIDTTGTSYAKKHDFNGTNGNQPFGSLVESNGKFWGMTNSGGASSDGVIFKIDTTGTGFAKVHDFDQTNGSSPFSSLVESNGKLWGLASSGGPDLSGVIFKIDTTGMAYAAVHYFNSSAGTNFEPHGSLLVSNGRLWGMTRFSAGFGTIFSIDTTGTNYTKTHDFADSNGARPEGGLVESNGKLWGLTNSGGASNGGVIYNINPNGTGFTKVYDFDHTDGGSPSGKLIESNGKFWGTAQSGGASGVIFNINTDGTDYTKVHVFTSANTNGTGPTHELVESNGKFFGMTRFGGVPIVGNTYGVIYSINTDGTGFTKIHDFDIANGSRPQGSLVVSNGKLWGMTTEGGTNATGVLFSINTDGTGFTKILDFTGVNGSSPYGNLVESNGKLWGMTNSGGLNGFGRIFTLDTANANYTSIHNFNETEGKHPRGNLVEFNGKLWGGTLAGGTHDQGVIFHIDTTGANFNVVLNLNPDETGGQIFRGALLPVYQNGLPGYTQIPDQNVDEDTQQQIDHTNYFDDFEDGPSGLVYTLENITNPSLFSSITLVSGILTLDPVANAFGSAQVQVKATDSAGAEAMVTYTANVVAVADDVTITPASTFYGGQSLTGLTVTKNPVDGSEVTHLQITDITNGLPYKNDGVTPIAENEFILVSEAEVGLKFTPSTVGTGSFLIQAATGNITSSLGGSKILATVLVEKAKLHAVADNKSKSFGEANPPLTVSYFGFVNTDDESMLDTVPIPSTTADITSTVGIYAITLSEGTDTRYDFTEVEGKLTVSDVDAPKTLFLPTLFTPNGDQKNDALMIRGSWEVEEINLTIFNKDGNIVFQSTDWSVLNTIGWDGTKGGKEQPQGGYIWVVKGIDALGSPILINDRQQKGIITLLR